MPAVNWGRAPEPLVRRDSRRPRVAAWIATFASLLAYLGAVSFSAAAPPALSSEKEASESRAPGSDAWKSTASQRIAAHPGQAAVMIRHLESGETFAHREQEAFPTASLIKLPIMVEAYSQAAAGQLDLNKSITLTDDDKVPGSGILTPHFSAGASFSVRDAIRLMMAWSDNTATNLVIDQIGLEATSRTMRQLGLRETRLHSKVFRRDTSLDVERSRQFGLGSCSARDMIMLLEQLHQRKLASESHCAQMLEHLAACQDKSMLPRFLPAEAKVRHKTGSVTGVRTAAGLISGPGGTLALCVLTRENRPPGENGEDHGERLAADLAKLAFQHFHPPELLAAHRQKSHGLKVGDSGPRVQELQRQLNQRLQPSPALDVDGEFGPVTRAAVERFQRAEGLAPSGIVDTETARRLKMTSADK